jgi:hypothetical protein
MDRASKKELYGRVESVTGKVCIEIKAVEEFTELISELANIAQKLLHASEITKCDKNKLIDELSDVIITMEQSLGIDDAMEILESRIAMKHERLERKYLDGGLFPKLWERIKEALNVRI